MSRLSLWLALVFAFDGFVDRACEALGLRTAIRSARKASQSGQRESLLVLRLRVLQQERNLDVMLPGESALDVIARHVRVRNSWAHRLGLLPSEMVSGVASIVEWDATRRQAWISEAGWSELRCAVESLSRRIMALDQLDDARHGRCR